MSDRTAVFAAALIAQFGERAYAFALDQADHATGADASDVALSWEKIADAIADLPRKDDHSRPKEWRWLRD